MPLVGGRAVDEVPTVVLRVILKIADVGQGDRPHKSSIGAPSAVCITTHGANPEDVRLADCQATDGCHGVVHGKRDARCSERSRIAIGELEAAVGIAVHAPTQGRAVAGDSSREAHGCRAGGRYTKHRGTLYRVALIGAAHRCEAYEVGLASGEGRERQGWSACHRDCVGKAAVGGCIVYNPLVLVAVESAAPGEVCRGGCDVGGGKVDRCGAAAGHCKCSADPRTCGVLCRAIISHIEVVGGVAGQTSEQRGVDCDARGGVGSPRREVGHSCIAEDIAEIVGLHGRAVAPCRHCRGEAGGCH